MEKNFVALTKTIYKEKLDPLGKNAKYGALIKTIYKNKFKDDQKKSYYWYRTEHELNSDDIDSRCLFVIDEHFRRIGINEISFHVPNMCESISVCISQSSNDKINLSIQEVCT